MTIFIFFFFILQCLIKYSYQFHCGTDLLPINKPLMLKIGNINNNRKLSTDFSQMKIKVDDNMIKSQIGTNGVTEETVNKIVLLLKGVSNIFNNLLSVTHYGNIILEASTLYTYCKIEKSDPALSSPGIDADLIIFPKINAEMDSNVQAAATFCACDSAHGNRPILGYVDINPSLQFNKENTDKYLTYLFLHEMTHVLVFHQQLMGTYWTGSKAGSGKSPFLEGNANGIKRTMIGTPKVVEMARKHFGCDTLNGVEVENQGGEGSAGSHWETRIMLGDYMIASDYPEMTISDITLALFEDSGWYHVNYYTGGLFRFGKGMGCGFLNNLCINSENTAFKNDFCTSSRSPRCTSGRLSKGICYLGSTNVPQEYQYFSSPDRGGFLYADYCPIAFDTTVEGYFLGENCAFGKSSFPLSLGETISENSICVLSSLTPNGESGLEAYQGKKRAICHEIECDFDSEVLFIKIGNSKITCPVEGGTVSGINGFNGEIECPDFNLVCTSEQFCNDIESCLNKKQEVSDNSFIYLYNPVSYDSSYDSYDNSGIGGNTQTKKKNVTKKGKVELLRVNLIVVLFMVSIIIL